MTGGPPVRRDDSRRAFDEDDVRIRPGRGSRPRTRRRPAHADAVPATVVGVDRGRYACSTDAGRLLRAVRGGGLRRRSVVVGDRVGLSGDVSGTADTLARIVTLDGRTTVLRRTPDDSDPVERPVVANAELLVIVTALADPEPRPRLVDRCLVAAFDGGLTPVLCLTKSDLADPEPLRSAYRPLGIDVISSGLDDGGAGVSALRERLTGRTSVLFGHSGVGKSSLVNALVPDAGRAVGVVNETTGRGRHTSTSVVALPLPDGGWVADTPGIRSFGLGAVTVPHLLAAFPAVAEAAEHCLPGCDHRPGRAGCGLDAPDLPPALVASVRRLLASRDDDAGAA